MIKFVADTKEGQVIGLGLSKGNVTRLMQGLPIAVKLDPFGIPGKQVMLFFGETEQDMMKELIDAGLVGPESKINKEGS